MGCQAPSRNARSPGDGVRCLGGGVGDLVFLLVVWVRYPLYNGMQPLPAERSEAINRVEADIA